MTLEKRAEYGKELLKSISKDLFKSLSWSHFVRLSSVRDENERSF